MVTSRPPDPRRFDVAAAAAAGSAIGGEWPLEALPRLAEATLAAPPADRPPVRWRAGGLRAALPGAGVKPALDLVAEATVRLECQRCLEPMEVPLAVDRRFFFVEGEDQAAALDADLEEDVLSLEPALDLRELVEDELLLALPLVPRHAECPEPLPVRDDEAPVEHPFAALAALKGRAGAG
jgi:uncharacterized protein